MNLSSILSSPAERSRLFPATREGIFLAHAAVAPITGPAREAMDLWSAEAAAGRQESESVWKKVAQTRAVAARFLGCEAEEISLLGPTALGLGLVALGLDWKRHVVHDPDLMRPSEILCSRADTSRASEILGWRAVHGMRDVARMMVEAWRQSQPQPVRRAA